MSLPYNDLPVYVGSENSDSFVESTAYLPATQANVSYTTTSSPRRPLGSAIATGDQFAFNQALQASISVTCVLAREFESAYAFASADKESNYFPIKIGDNVYKKCYLTSSSINVAPYVPVTLNAEFVSLEPANNQKISGDYSIHSRTITGDRLIYGHTCGVVNMDNAVGNVQSNVSFKKTLNRTPVYTLGSVNATSMLLDGVQKEMQISSTGLANLIDYSGELLNSATQVNLVSSFSQTISGLETLSMNAGSRVSMEGYSTDGGDTVKTTATIKQVTL
jgi:hypothetical protein